MVANRVVGIVLASRAGMLAVKSSKHRDSFIVILFSFCFLVFQFIFFFNGWFGIGLGLGNGLGFIVCISGIMTLICLLP